MRLYAQLCIAICLAVIVGCMTRFPRPIELYFGAAFSNVFKCSTTMALWLISMIIVIL